MVRTKDNGKGGLVAMSELVSRLALASKLGFQYSGDRDIYEALGYKKELVYADFYAQYSRQDIAGAIIDRPAKATWRGDVELQDGEQETDTALEKAWKELYDTLKLKSKFLRLDKLTGIGRFGILLLGFNDTTTKDMLAEPVTRSNSRQLLYVKPYSEDGVTIKTWETDARNPRFGLPLTYQITSNKEKTNSLNNSPLQQTLLVHHTRLLHVTDGQLHNELEGTPVLEKVFNRLKDLEKIVGGSAEMYWRGARPGYQGKVAEGYQATTALMTDLKTQIDEYEHNLRRILINDGVELSALETQVKTPKDHVDVQIQMISAETGIPKRILTGSERGELSSAQDNEAWLTLIKGRREEFATPGIIEPFIERCIEFGALPKASDGKYTIIWEDLFAQSEKAKAEIGKIRADALKSYTSNSLADTVIPREVFIKHFLGFTDEEAAKLAELMEAQIIEEQEDITAEEEDMNEEEPVTRTR